VPARERPSHNNKFDMRQPGWHLCVREHRTDHDPAHHVGALHIGSRFDDDGQTPRQAVQARGRFRAAMTNPLQYNLDAVVRRAAGKRTTEMQSREDWMASPCLRRRGDGKKTTRASFSPVGSR